MANLGGVYKRQGLYQHAASHFQRALTLAREIGDQEAEAAALDAVGSIYRRLGRYANANLNVPEAETIANQLLQIAPRK